MAQPTWKGNIPSPLPIRELASSPWVLCASLSDRPMFVYPLVSKLWTKCVAAYSSKTPLFWQLGQLEPEKRSWSANSYKTVAWLTSGRCCLPMKSRVLNCLETPILGALILKTWSKKAYSKSFVPIRNRQGWKIICKS